MTRKKFEKRWMEPEWSQKQRVLVKKYGTPAEFAAACYACVPGFISMTEAREAAEKYQREWDSSQ